jgi:pentatricopeptide repeat protein
MLNEQMAVHVFSACSLISFAGRLVRIEEEEERIHRNTRTLPQPKNRKKMIVMTSEVLDMCNTKSGLDNDPVLDGERISKAAPRAIDVYTELMKSMMRTSGDTMDMNTSASGANNTTAAKQSMLLKVFLVFQEMKGAGCIPDITCYNSLLRACARAGDVVKAQDVVREMERNGILPNDVTWKQLLKAAARSKSSHSAEQTWNFATGATNATSSTYQWKPDMEAFEALIASYWGEAFLPIPSMDSFAVETKKGSTETTPLQHPTKSYLLMSKIVNLYEGVQMQSYRKNDDVIHNGVAKKSSNDSVKGLSSMTLEELHGNQRLMLMILHSAVSLELMAGDGIERTAKNTHVVDEISAARKVAILISSLACLRRQEKQATAFPFFAVGGSVMKRVWKSLELAKLWAKEEEMAIV